MKSGNGAKRGPSLYLGVFICLVFTTVIPAFGQPVEIKTVTPFDPRVSKLVEIFYEYNFAIVDGYPDLGTREAIAKKIMETSLTSGFDAGLITAVCHYEDEHTKAEARLYQFHIETGLTLADAHLPRVWEDLERVANVLTWIQDSYGDDLRDIIAYYFVGARGYPPDGFDGLNDVEKTIIEGIIARADEYQVAIDKAMEGPLIVEVDDSPPSWEAPIVSDLASDEVREAYVSAILYFNPRLDEETTNSIFNAIAFYAGEFETIDARFVMALVACESSFRPDCVSHAGAMGLGQLMPFTAESHGVDDPFDIPENIRATYEYLQREFERWAGKEHIYDYVLASYNAGAGAVSKYGGIPPYDETINYVYKVTKVYRNFLRDEEYERYIFGKSKHYSDPPL